MPVISLSWGFWVSIWIVQCLLKLRLRPNTKPEVLVKVWAHSPTLTLNLAMSKLKEKITEVGKHIIQKGKKQTRKQHLKEK